MAGLVVRSPWIEQILAGEKDWELRGTRTHARGRVALIRGGAGLVVGTCRVVDCLGPLTGEQLVENLNHHRVPAEQIAGLLPFARTFAWVLADARPLPRPVPYRHPPGAVIWVRLTGEVAAAVAAQGG